MLQIQSETMDNQEKHGFQDGLRVTAISVLFMDFMRFNQINCRS
ncbi:hypothetical protein HOLDEFILI_03832 [Holdemania filiformis DSM 12042]|uniref:Uncharacterized protein n=1 Tax=Holdemania filiformis DSM 12042 TaxID=545696 RepID=B9YDB6_9FIRM|nr:hypothetical protein HOLDEFILI_03832 [Holdemania filiformis DSM 12042]